MKHAILGCGDVGRRIAQQLITEGQRPASILAFVRTSADQSQALGLAVEPLDLDQPKSPKSWYTGLAQCHARLCYYTIAPPKHGCSDTRTQTLLAFFTAQQIKPERVVVLSTTGVYGDCRGAWIDEKTVPNPETERGQRRLDSERQWFRWGENNKIDVIVLRVPGIYAYSRLPRQRLANGTPVVRARECGFTNRIHADDLAMVARCAMSKGIGGALYNVTDGRPGKITDYLQAAAAALDLPPLPEISMTEAQTLLSDGMLSYLNESRKISNQKIVTELGVSLRYPNFIDGLKQG